MLLFTIAAILVGIVVAHKVYWSMVSGLEYNVSFRKLDDKASTFLLRTVSTMSALFAMGAVLLVGYITM